MARKSSGDTKEKVLAAAVEVFVEKGFRDATVAEICRLAQANVSAVNYYFGSKEKLYQEAWRYSFSESIKAYPQDGGISPDAPVEKRFRGHIKALISRIADENNRDFFISQMEFSNPTGLLEEVMKSELIPMRERTLSLVRELLGPCATEEQILFSETCIIGMCLHPMLIQRVKHRAKNADSPVVIDDLDAFASHVMKFSMAGIAAVRGEIESDFNHGSK